MFLYLLMELNRLGCQNYKIVLLYQFKLPRSVEFDDYIRGEKIMQRYYNDTRKRFSILHGLAYQQLIKSLRLELIPPPVYLFIFSLSTNPDKTRI